MDVNLKRRAFERAVALKIAQDLTQALGPIMPEALAVKSDVVCRIFSDALDQNRIVDETAAERILHYVPAFLAELNFKFAELDRQLSAAIRPRDQSSTSLKEQS
jgi:hypothetical protein